MSEYGYSVTTLLEEQATRSGVVHALRQLFERDADNLLVYFSGHGACLPHGAYLCTVDADPTDPRRRVFHFSLVSWPLTPTLVEPRPSSSIVVMLAR